MSNQQLRARVPAELVEEIKEIAETIENENPGAEATTSTITRYALLDYVQRYNAKKHDHSVFLELPIKIPNEDLEQIAEHLIAIRKIYQNINHPLPNAYQKQLDILNETVMHLAVMSKQPNNDRKTFAERVNQLYKDAKEGK